MRIGQIKNALVVPTKHPSLNGINLLSVQLEGEKAIIIAADNLGAGIGDRVLISQSSHSISKIFPHMAVDAVVVGVF